MAFTPISVEDIELEKFKRSLDSIAYYKEGKAKLVASGIINFLRIFARPFSKNRGANVYESAYAAAFCEGYNKCLDDLVYFEERYLTEGLGKKSIIADFGGRSLALQKGDLTKDDLDGK